MSLSARDAARDAPDRLALVGQGVRLTFRELAARVAARQAGLRAGGVRRGGRPVALVADNSVATFVTLHALLEEGVPVHLLHSRLRPEEREALLRAMGAVPLVEPPGEPDPGDPDESGGSGRSGSGGRGPAGDGPDADHAAAPPAAVDPEAPAVVVYTSGTSGRPRGVILSRRALVASATASAANLGWRDDDRWLLRLPLAHVGGLSMLVRCLLGRRCVVLADPDAADDGIPEQVEAHRATLVSLVPTLLHRLLDRKPRWDPPPHLRAILLGGAAATPELLARAADRAWPVLTTYGMSETASQVATQPPGTVNRGDLGAGRPLPGVELEIGDDGAILVRGDVLFSGYADPGAGGGGGPVPTAGPPLTADGWFDTGDAGRIDDDGFLHVAGRRDDTVITGGENVDPGEVEAALRSCETVVDALVFGVPDPEWGQRLCAAVVPAPGAPREAAALEAVLGAELRERLAPFKRPRALVVVDRIPVNRLGKPDRLQAARLLADG